MANAGLEDLRAALRGNLLLPGDEAYEKAMLVWAVSPHQPSPPPRPAAVVQPRGTADVVAAVKWATSRGLPLAAKCGGHGLGNPTWVDGGLMLDLSLMRSVFVDPEAKVAVADGGCLACDVDAETALHSLATPLGICSVVGVGGLALNGGLSLLSRALGATCDNILEIQMVLADGSVAHVTAESDPELFWAARGAGTALGIATKLKLRLHDVSGVYCGALVWPDDPKHDTFRGILRWVRDIVLPDDSIGFNLARAVHPEMGPVLISMVVVLGGKPREAKEAKLKPLRDLGPVQDTVGASTWLQTQRTHEPAVVGLKAAFPVHYELASGGMATAEQVTDEFIEAMVRWYADELPPELYGATIAFVELAGGALKRSAAPIGFQDRDLHWVVQAGWTDPAHGGVGAAYTEALREALVPLSAASAPYINAVDTAEVKGLSYAEAADKVGGAANLERLRAVKARVDPGNVFQATAHTKVLAARAP